MYLIKKDFQLSFEKLVEKFKESQGLSEVTTYTPAVNFSTQRYLIDDRGYVPIHIYGSSTKDMFRHYIHDQEDVNIIEFDSDYGMDIVVSDSVKAYVGHKLHMYNQGGLYTDLSVRKNILFTALFLENNGFGIISESEFSKDGVSIEKDYLLFNEHTPIDDTKPYHLHLQVVDELTMEIIQTTEYVTRLTSSAAISMETSCGDYDKTVTVWLTIPIAFNTMSSTSILCDIIEEFIRTGIYPEQTISSNKILELCGKEAKIQLLKSSFKDKMTEKENKLESAQRDVANLVTELQLLKITNDSLTSKAWKEFYTEVQRCIQIIDRVENIVISKYGIVTVLSNTLFAPYVDEGGNAVMKVIGKLAIAFDLADWVTKTVGDVRIHNRNFTVNRHDTPHTSHGSPCLGSHLQAFSDTTALDDLEGYIRSLLHFASTYDEDDGWGRSIRHFPNMDMSNLKDIYPTKAKIDSMVKVRKASRVRCAYEDDQLIRIVLNTSKTSANLAFKNRWSEKNLEGRYNKGVNNKRPITQFSNDNNLQGLLCWEDMIKLYHELGIDTSNIAAP